ncbi:MAG: hypothetical protein WD638_14090 [Nitriliruptoraceae bacterium]
MSHHRAPRRRPAGYLSWRVVPWLGGLCVALLLAGCGGDEPGDDADDGTALPADETSSDPEQEPAPEDVAGEEPDAAGDGEAAGDGDADAEPDPDPAPDGDADAEPDPDPAPDEPADAPTTSATGEHRPPPAAQASADCTTVTDPPPGAIIAFPADTDPTWLDAGPGPVLVEFIGCSESFEANLQYEAFHEQDTSPTLSGITEGGTLGTWDSFGFEETFWTPGDWTVVVFVNEGSSGARVEYDEVTFTVD